MAPISDLAFSSDGKRLATASDDKTVKLWNASSGQDSLTLFGHTDAVLGVGWSPDNKWVASASLDHTAKLWDAVSGHELVTLLGHSQAVTRVAFSPDGKRLATSSTDKTVQVYVLDIRELIALARTRVTRDLTTQECTRYFQSRVCPPWP